MRLRRRGGGAARRDGRGAQPGPHRAGPHRLPGRRRQLPLRHPAARQLPGHVHATGVQARGTRRHRADGGFRGAGRRTARGRGARGDRDGHRRGASGRCREHASADGAYRGGDQRAARLEQRHVRHAVRAGGNRERLRPGSHAPRVGSVGRAAPCGRHQERNAARRPQPVRGRHRDDHRRGGGRGAGLRRLLAVGGILLQRRAVEHP